MKFAADFHIHSRFSRATSKSIDLHLLAAWASIKGISVVGTGDFTHPGWFDELRKNLIPAENGLFMLREDNPDAFPVPESCKRPVRFMLTTEISNIYKKGDRVRKVHNVVLVPDFDKAAALMGKLSKIGNLSSDGRPILGLDSELLLQYVLDSGDGCHLIPAHIWTPWFSALGSKSGFDSIEECYGDLTSEIFSVETGLSSDPLMNRMVSDLDKFTLVSCSDAHSAQKLGREATLFDTELSYWKIMEALKTGKSAGYRGTVEFYPEEGKYHLDGHRKCGIRLTPEETEKYGGLCPVCGKPVTVGVMNRVFKLADRVEADMQTTFSPFHSNIPLVEILSEIIGTGPGSKKVMREYFNLLGEFGPELDLLMKIPTEELISSGHHILGIALERMRRREIIVKAGFDGEYGRITLFRNGEIEELKGQSSLFTFGDSLEQNGEENISSIGKSKVRPINPDDERDSPPPDRKGHPDSERKNRLREPTLFGSSDMTDTLDEFQKKAALSTEGVMLIEAGPGAGKTKTLITRIRILVERENVPPEKILALTFTNRAAEEMRTRLGPELCPPERGKGVRVGTFHSLCFSILRTVNESIRVLDGKETDSIVTSIRKERPVWKKIRSSILKNALSRKYRNELPVVSNDYNEYFKQLIPQKDGETGEIPDFATFFELYEQRLNELGAVDFDSLVNKTNVLLSESAEIRNKLRSEFSHVSVDEFQDVDAAQFYFLLQLMDDDNPNLCAIGDPRQSIYGFRGSTPLFMELLTEIFPKAKKISLRNNYRSSNIIVSAASSIAEKMTLPSVLNNEEKIRFSMVAGHGTKHELPVAVVRLATQAAEAEFITHSIEQLTGGISHFSMDSGRTYDSPENLDFSEIAVLARTRAVLAPVASALDRLGVPYRTNASTLVTETPEGKRIIQILQKLSSGDFSGQGGKSAVRFVSDGMTPGRIFVSDMIRIIAEKSGFIEPGEFRGYGTQNTNSIGLSEKRSVELMNLAYPFGKDLVSFIDYAETLTTDDTSGPAAGKVSLLSLHASKGLEFKIVFIAGCELGLLPKLRETTGEKDWTKSISPGSGNDAFTDFQEELRLFYVGLTRAISRVYLTSAGKRLLSGKYVNLPVSPFIDLIDKRFKITIEPENGKRQYPGKNLQRTLF